MKLRSIVFGLVLVSLSVLMVVGHPLRAQETNEPNHGNHTEKKKVFIFDGGNPIDFIVALDKHFRTRLIQVLTLPETLSRAQVPKLRVAADDPREVLTLYNRLQSPTLGQWRFEPEGAAQNPPSTNMNVLMLVPDKSTVAGKVERGLIKVKGVALAGVPEAKWDALARDIDEARRYGAEAASKGVANVFEGSFHFQRESKVLIVSGSEAYLEMAESLVSAHRVNAEIETKAVSGSKPPPAATGER